MARRESHTAVGRVTEPTAVGTASTNDPRTVQEDRPRQPNPIRERVEPRERHISGADLKWNQVVRESRCQGHDEQEHHGHAMHGEHLVIDIGRQHAAVGYRQLQANQQGLNTTHHEENHGGHAIHDPDLLVIDGAQPVPPAPASLRPGKHPEGPLRQGLAAGFKF